MKATLLYVLTAIALFALVLSGIVLRGRDAIAALSWGWEDIVTPVNSELKHKQRVNFGVYDLGQRFTKAKGVAAEHIFVSWLSSNASSTIISSFAYAKERNRWLMITVEPFAVEGRRSELLDDVVAGVYDSMITSICQTIGSLKSPTYVRWGHEMEGIDVRYPWSGAQGDRYIAAYRHFAARCRANAPDTLFVWSPKGNPGLAEYYPGKAFVDFVGVSVYALPAYDLEHFGKVMNFRESFTPKYHRIITFDRPVMIAEMGVSGDPKYQAYWMSDFFRNAQTFPWLRMAVYYNSRDNPDAWPEKYGRPDWTIDPNIFE